MTNGHPQCEAAFSAAVKPNVVDISLPRAVADGLCELKPAAVPGFVGALLAEIEELRRERNETHEEIVREHSRTNARITELTEEARALRAENQRLASGDWLRDVRDSVGRQIGVDGVEIAVKTRDNGLRWQAIFDGWRGSNDFESPEELRRYLKSLYDLPAEPKPETVAVPLSAIAINA